MNTDFYRNDMTHFDPFSVTHFDKPRLDTRIRLGKMNMTRYLLIILIMVCSTSQINAQSSIWFPKELNIQPFTANFLEPKAGFLFNTSDDKIRLDIGTSQDILHLNNQNNIFSFGADLFTFTRLRSENDFHFPVETIDYLFGLNSSFRKIFENYEVGIRFRFSHISAHLVDGRFDKATNQWREGRLPLVYSREFLELFPFIRFKDLRFYAGLTYIFHSSPKYVKKGIYQLGFDYFATQFSFSSITPFVAYDFKLNGNEKYVGNNFINFGLKIGQFNKKGFSIYYSYISGMSVHGEYLGVKENYSSIGFNLDL